jgi:hypothetical protein
MDSVVPFPQAPRVGDMQYGPPTDLSHSNNVRHPENVFTPSQSEHQTIDLYAVGENDGVATPRPFIHQVEL